MTLYSRACLSIYCMQRTIAIPDGLEAGSDVCTQSGDMVLRHEHRNWQLAVSCNVKEYCMHLTVQVQQLLYNLTVTGNLVISHVMLWRIVMSYVLCVSCFFSLCTFYVYAHVTHLLRPVFEPLIVPSDMKVTV